MNHFAFASGTMRSKCVPLRLNLCPRVNWFAVEVKGRGAKRKRQEGDG